MAKEFLVIDRGGSPTTVRRADYVRLKTLDLQEFGFVSLTEAALEEQVQLVLRGQLKRLSAPGKFIEKEVLNECD